MDIHTSWPREPIHIKIGDKGVFVRACECLRIFSKQFFVIDGQTNFDFEKFHVHSRKLELTGTEMNVLLISF